MNNKKNKHNNNLRWSLWVIILSVFMFYSFKQESGYIITGTTARTDLEGKQIVLSKEIGGKIVSQDTVVMTNGKYVFKGTVKGQTFGRIEYIDRGRANPIASLIIENANILVFTDAQLHSTVKGKGLTGVYEKYLEKENEIINKTHDNISALSDPKLNAAERKSKKEENKQLALKKDLLAVQFMKENINNVAGQGRLDLMLNSLSLGQMKEIISTAKEKTLKEPAVAMLAQRIATLEKTAVGQPFTDLHMLNPEGKEVALSDYAGKGKYIIIDFWASWCGPCLAEMPNLKALYQKYKDKGLEVVGVSFDNVHDAWVRSIKSVGMPWPQMSDLERWDSKAVKEYAIFSIPHTILLDKNGVIIYRGTEDSKGLKAKLAEVMK